MKIVNEEDALLSLRRRAELDHDQGAEDRLNRLHGTMSAVKKFSQLIREDPAEVALFVGKEHCWFFGNILSFRSTIPASNEPSEITCYVPTRDFGQITVTRDTPDGGMLSVQIAGVTGAAPIELEASGRDAGALGALEQVLPFLFGHGGSKGNDVAGS